MPDYSGNLVAIGDDIGAIGVISVKTIAGRDALFTGGSLRVESIVYVQDDAAYYRLTSLTPTWENKGPTLFDGGGGVTYNVSNTTTRDLLTPTVGQEVFVISLSLLQRWDGATWRTVGKGNYALRSILTDSFAILELNADLNNGNDETGNGSQGSPFATHQRCIDELPPGISGIVVIHTRGGVQAQVVVDVNHITGIGAEGITIFIVGDTTEIESVTLATDNGEFSNITNPNTGNYISCHRMGESTGYTTNIDERVHFLYQPFDYLGVEFPQSYIPVGTIGGTTSHESTTGVEIGVLAPFGPTGVFSICTHTTTITPSPADVAGAVNVMNRRFGDGVSLQYYGCEFLGTEVVFQSASAFECRVNNRDAFFYGRSSFNIQKSGTGDVFALSPLDTNMAGVWESGDLRIDPSSYRNDSAGFQVLGLGPLLIRGNNATKVRVANNQYGGINIVEVRYCDFVDGTAYPFYVRDSKITFRSSKAVAIEATAAGVVSAEGNSRLIFPGDCVQGETSGVCILLDKGSAADGVSNLVNLTSAVGATNEIQLGDATAQAFTAGPAGDLASMSRFS
jgi:hypothetical protein